MQNTGGNATAYDISAHRITSDWDEGGACGGNSISNWTNRIAAGTIPWTNAGGDFIAAESTRNVAGNGPYSWDVKNMAQFWVNNHAQNFGVLLKAVAELTGQNHSKNFGSRTNGTAANRPILYLKWHRDSCVAIPPNRPPLANPDYGFTTNSITPLVIDTIKNNDSDNNPIDVVSVVMYSGPGSVSVMTGNGFTYTPAYGVPGNAVVKYVISDGSLTDTSLVYITITNTPVSAVNDTAPADFSGDAVLIDVIDNDIDPEDRKGAVTILTQPAHGVAFVDNNTQEITYISSSTYYGPDSLTYEVCEDSTYVVCDEPLNCSSATVYFDVLNRPPVSEPDTFNLSACDEIEIFVLANDTDPEGRPLTLAEVYGLDPGHAGGMTINIDGSVTFLVAPGFLGTATFFYVAEDDGGLKDTSVASVIVTVPTVNPPVALNDTDYVDQYQILYTTVDDNDYDPDGRKLDIPSITIPPTFGIAHILPNGIVEYIPDSSFYGEDELTYEICNLVADPATCILTPGLCEMALLTIIVEQYMSLPIELSYFNAVKDGQQSKLDWATLSEINNERFDLEWSTNGRTFTKIGEVAGAGNSTSLEQYTFFHTDPAIGNNYYRLRQIDFDGKFGFSPVRVVNFARENNQNALLYPNPSRTASNLMLTGYQNKKVSISIFDVGGRQIVDESFVVGSDLYKFVINTELLSEGSYFVSVRDLNDNTSIALKLFVQH